ncbi:MAG: hypothetical protein R3D69_10975 [Xanthobacteraceae bacterium]
MTGTMKAMCRAGAVALLLAVVTAAPAKAQFGGGDEDTMAKFAPMLEMMKAKMGKKRFAMLMQTAGMMSNMMEGRRRPCGGLSGMLGGGGLGGGLGGGFGDLGGGGGDFMACFGNSGMVGDASADDEHDRHRRRKPQGQAQARAPIEGETWLAPRNFLTRMCRACFAGRLSTFTGRMHWPRRLRSDWPCSAAW